MGTIRLGEKKALKNNTPFLKIVYYGLWLFLKRARLNTGYFNRELDFRAKKNIDNLHNEDIVLAKVQKKKYWGGIAGEF